MPTVGEIVAYLREQGQLHSLVGALGVVGEQPITRPNVDGKAQGGEVAWTKRVGAAEEFGGSLLICGHEGIAGREVREDLLVAVCERPRLAMARVIGRFFSQLATDRPAEFADPVLAEAVAVNGSWVRNARVAVMVSIGPHCVIGCSGMGYERDDAGRLVPFPQVGGVVIESDVDIAAQAMIQRAAMGDTVIRHGAKVGPHVNVGHNVEIGEDVLVTGHCQIGGGTSVGAGAVLWQSAAVANGVRIGEAAVIGMGAMVLKDVPAGVVVVGNPARPLPSKH